ncbi:MAG: hypothetical protein IPN86_21925 [Saprospiraceae bacterium]|nr:hypothetical protein [Saprospiraceae bacterium]
MQKLIQITSGRGPTNVPSSCSGTSDLMDEARNLGLDIQVFAKNSRRRKWVC